MNEFDFNAEIEFLDARIAALNDGRTHSVRPKGLVAVITPEPTVQWYQPSNPTSWAPDPDVGSMPVAKGSCPKCGKHVGRGIGLHVKRCQG